MSWLDRLRRWVERKQMEIQEARVEYEQLRAERLREKQKRVSELPPGVKRTILEGLMYRKSPLEVMREEWDRRKYEREKKKK